jgi:DNA polymerase III alpha subunit
MLMKTDNLGIPRFSNRDLIDMIYSGHIDKCHVVLCEPSDEIDKFNSAMKEQGLPELTKYIPLDVDKAQFDEALRSEWFMPDGYKNVDVYNYVSSKCKTDKELIRALEELEEFEKRGLLDLLRYMIYLVDFMRENKIVWGVGRGSSVASYVLYLIGVHRVNSINYNLDWREFLR